MEPYDDSVNNGLQTLCPICNGQASFEFALKRRRFFRCTGDDCGTLFVWPQPSEKELRGFYEEDYFASQEPKHRLASSEMYAQIMDYLLKRVSIGRPRILDYGCARAGLWDVLPSPLKECYWSIESNEAAREEAHRRTGRPSFGTIEEFSEAGQETWDICVMNQVIEHLRDPLGDLKKLISASAPRGLLWLATPNLGCLRARLLGKRWPQLADRTHLYLFTGRSCRNILARAGFKSPRRRSFRLRYGDMGFLRRFAQVFLRGLKLDGNLTLIAAGRDWT